MKTINRLRAVFLALAFLAALPAARAAVHASMELEHNVFLRFESIRARLTIYNDTDDPFIIDGVGTSGSSQLYFEVRYRGRLLPVREGEPHVGRILVLPDERRVAEIDLCDAFPLSREGRYFIKAIASQADEAWESEMTMIDIVPGMPVASTERVVEGYPGRLRKFSLRYWPRDGHEHLFLSVDEQRDGYNFGVFELGRLLRVSKPSLRVNRKGEVRVWHQCASDRYVLSALQARPDEVSLVGQTYHLEDGSPYPKEGDQGDVQPLVVDKPKARWWEVWRWFEPKTGE